MKAPLVLALAVFLAVSCALKPDAPGTDALSPASVEAQGEEARKLLERYMPGAMTDGMVKAAVFRTLSVSDHARQFLEGCAAEGRAMGFVVDVFTVEGEERCLELAARIAGADYDGIILSVGNADFTRKALAPALERGLKVVTFDAYPFKEGSSGEVLPGVTATFQDDGALARISLEAIVSRFGGTRPARVIRAWYGPGIPPLDRRGGVYDEFVRRGAIVETAFVRPADFAWSRTGARDALASLLPDIPPGSADAVWASYEEFAKGCADALEDADRTDIKMLSIDISNDDIRLMLEHEDLWLGAAAVDARLTGAVSMRLLAAKFAGEETPPLVTFNARFVETSMLDKRANMTNLGEILPGWNDDAGLFAAYPWMAELKAAGGYGR